MEDIEIKLLLPPDGSAVSAHVDNQMTVSDVVRELKVGGLIKTDRAYLAARQLEGVVSKRMKVLDMKLASNDAIRLVEVGPSPPHATDFIVAFLDAMARPASTNQIRTALRDDDIKIKDSSLNWALANLNSSKRIRRVERGIYEIGRERPPSRLEEALASYQIAILSDPNDVSARIGRASVLFEMGRTTEAIEAYEAIIRKFPENIVAYNGLAESFHAMGRLDEALATYESAILQFPRDVFAYNGRAEVFRTKAELDSALMTYESAIEQFPDNVVAYNGRAHVLDELGQLDEALRQFESTIIRFPSDHVARVGRADLLRRLGRLEAMPTPPSAESIPRPEKRAIQFGGRANGPIDLAAVSSPGEHLQNDDGRREDYAELREKATFLNSFGTNRLAHLHEPVSRFLNLPEDIIQLRAKIFWSRINSLRIALDGHEQAAVLSSEPDERKLEASVAGALKDLVETINVFMVGDTTLMDLDSARPGPQEIRTAKEEIQALVPMLNEAVTNDEIATEAAQEVLSEQASNLREISESLHERQGADFSLKTIRNFVGELLRRAYAPVRTLAKTETSFAWKGVREGAYRAVGAGILIGGVNEVAGVTNFHDPLIRFVARHSETLSSYVMKAFQNPVLVDIVNWIARLGS